MTWPHFHRWSEWETEFEECPDDWMGVYEIRVRECTRKRCDMIEEIPRLVSANQIVLHLHEQWRRAV
jgi:hypothetical protein